MLFAVDANAQKKKKKQQDAAPQAETEKEKDRFNSGTFSGLKWRAIGPATTSGRVADFAVNPEKHSEYYVAVASGGVWKTTNAGTTYEPIFDRQGSYSIGCVTLDPNNPNVVWVGTGENNGQRSIAYGDGVYKSTDGGKSWKNMGLKDSEHIGNIVVHPHNSDVVFVAAHGPLWSAGGDRGLYKSTNGGKDWKNVLEVDEHTGVNEVHLDPRNPDVMYASTWQRRRHVWTFLGGGPGSALYKSTDGGETWFKSEKGLPGGDKGRIALAISPVNPDIVYAIVEASGESSGFFRSTDRGASWHKRNSYVTSGNYYQELIPHPTDADIVFFMDTWAHVTYDGGKTVKRLGNERYKHVDNHCMWINPDDTDHWLMGCDGGIYETWNAGEHWQYKANLSITQFYKVATDNAEPFYFVYGGTQDNNTLGGPSRTTNRAGITNNDWFITNGGDGFEAQIDPTDPNVVYAQSQYGFLWRFDKRSGERISIKPIEDPGEPALRWNWDAPLLISRHKNTRLYFAANKLFKSEDRGNSWTPISGDLSRQIDRNKLKVMGKTWGMDAINYHRSTTDYGNIVALDESPVKEGLLYAGTDDGLIHVSDDMGENWRKIATFPSVPETTYVNMVLASVHEEGTVYAAFNNHKNGDFKPYILKSTDKGQTWTSISGNLPERGSIYSIAEDHVDPNLIFVGTEFGVFFTTNGGEKWVQIKAGLPTIAVRDMEIQRRENDLVIATFGRGFYVLDDYTPLRNLSKEDLEKEAHIFPIKDALLFIESSPLGYRGKGFQGESFFTTPNPDVGAVFTYYIKESPKTLKQQRKEREKEMAKEGKDVTWPSWEDIRAEKEEEKASLLFTVTDEAGNVVRRIKRPVSAGMHRMVWDGHYPSSQPVSLRSRGGNYSPYASTPRGHRAAPGKYFVSMAISDAEGIRELVAKQAFNVKLLDNSTLPAKDPKAVEAFSAKVSDLGRAVGGANRIRTEMGNKLRHIAEAIRLTPSADMSLLQDVKKLEAELRDINLKLNGDNVKARLQYSTAPSISDRLGIVGYGMNSSTSDPTETMKKQYEYASKEFEPIMKSLKEVIRGVEGLEKKLEDLGAPYTPGRMPEWERE